MWAERYFALCKQELPSHFKGVIEIDEFVHHLAIVLLDSKGKDDIAFYPQDDDDYESPMNTVAYCEEAYEHGYSAIINDGKLLGFRKEEAL